MYGTISWSALIVVVVGALFWELRFNVNNKKGRRLPRWLRGKPKQTGLMPSGTTLPKPRSEHHD